MGIRVNWIKYIKLSESGDQAYSTCLFGDHIAVVGDAGGQASIALLDKVTGEAIRTWRGEVSSEFLNCLSLGNVLYTVGWELDAYKKAGIYAFDAELSVLKRAVSVNGEFSSIAYDGEYLYVGGSVSNGIDRGGDEESVWRIERRMLDLSLLDYKELYAEGWVRGFILNTGINPVTGEVWTVGGYEDFNGEMHSLLVVFDKKLKEIKRVDYPIDYLGGFEDVYFDGSGNAYVAGGGTLIERFGSVARFDLYGNLVAVNKNIGSANRIVYVDGRVYAFGSKEVHSYERHILYVLDSRLNLLDTYILSKNINKGSFFSDFGRASFDGQNIYVAGYDYASDNARWVVYSIAVTPNAE